MPNLLNKERILTKGLYGFIFIVILGNELLERTPLNQRYDIPFKLSLLIIVVPMILLIAAIPLYT